MCVCVYARTRVYMMYNVFNTLLLGYAHGTGYSVTIRVTSHLRQDITDAYAGTDGKSRVCCILNCTFSYVYWRHLMWCHKTHILKMNYRYVICYVHLPVSRHSGQDMIFALRLSTMKPWTSQPWFPYLEWGCHCLPSLPRPGRLMTSGIWKFSVRHNVRYKCVLKKGRDV